MKYHFICDNCNIEKTVDIPMGKLKDNPVYCDVCNEKMHQKYYDDNVVIPDYMKAGEDEDTTDWINDRLSNSRFSGKNQIYF